MKEYSPAHAILRGCMRGTDLGDKNFCVKEPEGKEAAF